MFRHIFIFALFATFVGYCFANEMPALLPENSRPVWPAPGSDADFRIGANADCDGADGNNIRILSRIGDDLVVENNINVGMPRGLDQGFSGGANMTHRQPAPHGFNIWEGRAEMPLMHAEMMEDDGGRVLVMSRSGRQRANRQQQQQPAPTVNWQQEEPRWLNDAVATPEPEDEVDVDIDFDEEQSAENQPDQVRSWVVASGRTLREVLQEWCDREGWDLVWATSREYPIQASAVFRGRFLDVSSALVRNFSRANPTPYAKFYKGNRVLVITTAGGE